MVKHKFMDLPQVLDMTRTSRSHLYALVAKKEFPSPIKLGLRSTRWLKSDSRVYRYLVEAFREGFIDQNELPESFPKMTREPKNPVSKALKTRLNALIEAA